MNSFQVFADGEAPRAYRTEEEALLHAQLIASRHDEPVGVYRFSPKPRPAGREGVPNLGVDVKFIAAFGRKGRIEICPASAAVIETEVALGVISGDRVRSPFHWEVESSIPAVPDDAAPQPMVFPPFGIARGSDTQHANWFFKEENARAMAERMAKAWEERVVVFRNVLESDEPLRTKYVFETAFTPDGEIDETERAHWSERWAAFINGKAAEAPEQTPEKG